MQQIDMHGSFHSQCHGSYLLTIDRPATGLIFISNSASCISLNIRVTIDFYYEMN